MERFNLDDYTIVPEKDVTRRVIYSDQNTLAYVLNILPGESMPEQEHFESTVLLQVISGTGRIIVDDQSYNVQEKDLVKIGGTETLSIHNTGNEYLEVYVTVSPLPGDERYSADLEI